jgi:hypothetical protein
MNNGFALALGLAAIDGLTSAFVAMLVLALAVIGSGEQSGATADISGQTILYVRKPLINFLVRVAPTCKVFAQRVPRGQADERLKEIESYTNGGSVRWIDCTPAPGDTICRAQLIINRPVRGEPWRIYFANANTENNFTEKPLNRVDVEFQVIRNGENAKPLNEWWTLDGSWNAFEFSPTGTNEIKKVDASKC